LFANLIPANAVFAKVRKHVGILSVQGKVRRLIGDIQEPGRFALPHFRKEIEGVIG
jgi:hypothetical protein